MNDDEVTHGSISGTISHPDDAPIAGEVVDKLVESLCHDADRLGLHFNVVWGPQNEMEE